MLGQRTGRYDFKPDGSGRADGNRASCAHVDTHGGGLDLRTAGSHVCGCFHQLAALDKCNDTRKPCADPADVAR